MTRRVVPVPEISGDGRVLAAQLGRDLVVAETSTGTITRLANDAGADRLALAPTGGYLAVVCDGTATVFAIGTHSVERVSTAPITLGAGTLTIDDTGAVAVASDELGEPRVQRAVPYADGWRVSPGGTHIVWWSVDWMSPTQTLTIGTGTTATDANDAVLDGIAYDGEHLAAGIDDSGTAHVAWGTDAGRIEISRFAGRTWAPQHTVS